MNKFILSFLFIFWGLFVSPNVFAWDFKGRDLMTGDKIQVVNGEKGSVLVFLSARCPCSNSHIDHLKALSAEFKKFVFIAIHSNQDEDQESSKVYFKSLGLPFPVIEDEGARIADEFKAMKTPHAYLIDKNGKIVYRGGVTSSNYAPGADENYLQNALREFSSGGSIKIPETRTLGCIISRRK